MVVAMTLVTAVRIPALGKDGTTEQAVTWPLPATAEMLKMRREAPVVMTVTPIMLSPCPAPRGSHTRASRCAAGTAYPGVSHPWPKGDAVRVSGTRHSPSADTTAGTMPSAVPGSNASRQLAEALYDAFTAVGFQVAHSGASLLPLGQGNLPRVLVELVTSAMN